VLFDGMIFRRSPIACLEINQRMFMIRGSQRGNLPARAGRKKEIERRTDE
jgi:hypothetical protein